KLIADQEDHHSKAEGWMHQITTLRAELEGARAEAAMSSAALDTARRERSGRPVVTETHGSLQSIVG
ncbi:MAG TPA: hypothetical protein VF633_12900, partial [Brevundimonas sp.]